MYSVLKATESSVELLTAARETIILEGAAHRVLRMTVDVGTAERIINGDFDVVMEDDDNPEEDRWLALTNLLLMLAAAPALLDPAAAIPRWQSDVMIAGVVPSAVTFRPGQQFLRTWMNSRINVLNDYTRAPS